MGKIFSVNGFFKDDKSEFSDFLISEYDDTPEGYEDEDIFFHGLSEQDLKNSHWNDSLDFVVTSFSEVTENENKHNYMLLARYQGDIEYFLNHGNRSERNLFFDTKEEHIEEIIKLWESLEPKPEWLTHAQLMDYKEKMLNN